MPARRIELLRQVPTLLDRSLPYERMALAKSLFERVWIKDRRIARLTPRADVGEVIASVVNVWDGVPDGFRTHNPLIHSQVLCH